MVQIANIINAGDLTKLSTLNVNNVEAAAILKVAMKGLADISGNHVVQEAARQGVPLAVAFAEAGQLSDWAELTTDMLGMGLAIAAGREAQRVAAPGMAGVQVAEKVDGFLASLSDAALRSQLGGALTAAQNAGRFATIRKGPEAALYASEKMDENTCAPCRHVDGRWLGNVSDMAQVNRTYPSSGYVDCLGGVRCRGTVVAVWRPKTTRDSD
jgi:hypothetical protein